MAYQHIIYTIYGIISYVYINSPWYKISRGETRTLIWGGGGDIRLPDEFLLKSVVFKFISKEISRAEHEYVNIQPPIAL